MVHNNAYTSHSAKVWAKSMSSSAQMLIMSTKRLRL